MAGAKDAYWILTAILFQVGVNNSLKTFAITSIHKKFAEFLLLYSLGITPWFYQTYNSLLAILQSLLYIKYGHSIKHKYNKTISIEIFVIKHKDIVYDAKELFSKNVI